ncbi:MAG: SIS domain-containing protein [Campylobacterota bacterium]|nr:SIS domain-containing protein [Campylobacterota bacterium]
MKNFIEKYTKELISLLENIDKDAIIEIEKALESSIDKNSKVYILGNGGSAATASHMVMMWLKHKIL